MFASKRNAEIKRDHLENKVTPESQIKFPQGEEKKIRQGMR